MPSRKKAYQTHKLRPLASEEREAKQKAKWNWEYKERC